MAVGNASGNLSNINITELTAVATGRALSSGNISIVTISGITGYAGSDGSASGNLSDVNISTVAASASSSIEGVARRGGISRVNVTAPKYGGKVSDIQFTAWLKSQSSRRCIIVEVIVNVSDVEITRYLSTCGYVTKPTESISNTTYIGAIIGGVKFTESIDLESSSGLSFGDIQIDNSNGIRDPWLDDVWVNRSIKVYVGDVIWDRQDFRLVFDGIVSDIDSKNRNVLNISIRDKLQRLNTPVTEELLGGVSINSEVLKPVLLGECFNITPLLTDGALLEYQIHNGEIERIIEVRDNGVPVSIVEDLVNGKFTLVNNPYGTITTSAQGSIDGTTGVYEYQPARHIVTLAMNYGKVDDRFTIDEIDTVSFNRFRRFYAEHAGLYIANRTNVLSAINELAKSQGAQVVVSRTGLLRMVRILFPIATNTQAYVNRTFITARDMEAGSLKIDKRTKVQSSVSLGFCKNWTVQSDLQTGIPQEHKDFFSAEWITRTASDSSVKDKYKLDSEPAQKDTLLLSENHASTEADRMLGIVKNPRTEYSFDGYANLIELELGDIITVTHNRFGMSNGVDAIVTKLQIDWINFKVKVGFML